MMCAGLNKHGPIRLRVRLIRKQRLSDRTMELAFERPDGLDMRAGQKVSFFFQSIARDYTLINAPDSDALTICVRTIAHGQLSPELTGSPLGTAFQISKPFGYFTYQPSSRPSVFVATGTGVAPFVAYARSGVRGFTLLHGARTELDLYYRQELAAAAQLYVPCLSTVSENHVLETGSFAGRVTGYLAGQIPVDDYGFYLCGRGEMIEAATGIIDRRFPGALVFSEPFF